MILKSLPITLLLFALTSTTIFGQKKWTERLLRLSSDTSAVDSSKYPFVPYEKVISYSFNRKGRAELKAAYKYHEALLKVDSIRQNERYFRQTFIEFDSMVTLYYEGEKSIVTEGKMANSAEEVLTISDAHLKAINDIFLDEEETNDPDINCLPFYRDGLVFYDREGKIVGVVNICFKCGHFRENPWVYSDFPMDTFKKWGLLRTYFKETLGHPIKVDER